MTDRKTLVNDMTQIETMILDLEDVTPCGYSEKPGVPDICLPVARGKYHGLYIELKAKGGRLSPEQREWQRALLEEGNPPTTEWDRMKAENDDMREKLMKIKEALGV